MANTLTNLIPDFYEALDRVSRELTGYIGATSRSSTVERAALNQAVIVPVTGAEAADNNTPGATPPDTGDTSVDNVSVAITKSRHVPVRWNGEETKGLQNAGTFSSIQADRFYQAMRTLVNEIEADIHAAVYKKASRAYGVTIGTAPFATNGDMSDFAGVLRILEENGAPTSDLQLVLGHSAMANMRGKMGNLFKLNEGGNTALEMLRNGMTNDRILKMAIRHSHAIGVHTAGAGVGADINAGAGEAVGQTSLTVHGITVNTSGYQPGDLVTLAGDTNKYVIADAMTATDGELVINKPGLLIAAPDTTEITHLASYTPNVAFARSAVVLATRPPALPVGGDAASDSIIVQDPISGLAFEIALYKQYLRNVYHVRLAWGTKAIKDEHIAILHG